MAMPAFTMASPKALEEGNADAVSGTGEAPVYDGTFGYENPVGTGPFQFDSWERGTQLTLTRERGLLGRAGPARPAHLHRDPRWPGAPPGARGR